jgi:hypothetical protein
MIDETRQIAVDFARLPELLRQTSGRSEVATSSEDDKLDKLETSRLPSVESPTTIPSAISFEPDGWMPTPLLREPSDPLSNRTKFLIAIAVGALPAGYFVFGNSDRPVDVAVAPQATSDIQPVKFLPLREAEATPAKATGITVESRVESEIQTTSLQPTARLDIEPTEGGIEARSPQTLPKRGRRSSAASRHASSCFPSASAVRQNHPGGWPSWTFQTPGHEGTRCWYAATRITAHDQPSEMRRRETAQTTEKELPVLFGLQY